MTVLQTLTRRYHRLAAKGDAPVPGFAPAQISFTIVLDSEGNVVDVSDERGGGKKPRPRVVLAPAPPKRTVGIASGAFWDKTWSVLGRTARIRPLLSRSSRDRAAGARQGRRRHRSPRRSAPRRASGARSRDRRRGARACTRGHPSSPGSPGTRHRACRPSRSAPSSAS